MSIFNRRKKYLYDDIDEQEFEKGRGDFLQRYLGRVDMAQLSYLDAQGQESAVAFYIKEVLRRFLEMVFISFVASGCLFFVYRAMLWSYIIKDKDGYERVLIVMSTVLFFGMNFYLLRRMILITMDLKMYITINALAYVIYTAFNIFVFFWVRYPIVYFSMYLYTLLISAFAGSQLLSLIVMHVLYLIMLVFIGLWGIRRFVQEDLSVEDYRAMQRGRRRSIWRS